MNEDEVRSALRDVVVASSPPPPMDTGTAVEVGRKAHRRRRATRAGVVAGLAVVGIAVGGTFLPQALSGGGGLLDAASGNGDGKAIGATETSWPNGQTDRTATNGPRADKSMNLMPVLGEALPPGLVVGEKPPNVNIRAQSQFKDYAADGGEVWEYQATAPVTKTDGSQRVGTLFVQVTTAGNPIPAEPCAAAAHAAGIRGTCQVVDAGGKQVGLLTSDGSGTEQVFEQLAAYRYPDGTVVYVAQATTFRDSGLPALDARPSTEDQLAALAIDPRFHLD